MHVHSLTFIISWREPGFRPEKHFSFDNLCRNKFTCVIFFGFLCFQNDLGLFWNPVLRHHFNDNLWTLVLIYFFLCLFVCWFSWSLFRGGRGMADVHRLLNEGWDRRLRLLQPLIPPHYNSPHHQPQNFKLNHFVRAQRLVVSSDENSI